MIKGQYTKKYNNFIYLYVLDNWAQRYKSQKLKGKTDNFIIIVVYFNTFLYI